MQGIDYLQGSAHLVGLLGALRRLDALLERAVGQATTAYGSDAAGDAYRGLYVSQSEAQRLLVREPGVSPLAWEPQRPLLDVAPAGSGSPFATLARMFDLTSFDLEILLIALAPEIDLRYERLYAYLQDDVTRRRPTVDLAFNLLVPTFEERILRREHFDSSAPLIANRLLYLIPDPLHLQPPLLSHYLKPDEQILRFLLGHGGHDSRLVSFCKMTAPTVTMPDGLIADTTQRGLASLIRDAGRSTASLRLHFSGPGDSSKQRVAGALAGELGMCLLQVDLAGSPSEDEAFTQAMQVLLREATLREALVFVEGIEALQDGEPQSKAGRRQGQFIKLLAGYRGVVILASERAGILVPGSAHSVIDVPFPVPSHRSRRAIAEAALQKEGQDAAQLDLDAFAGRFRLTSDQIAAVVTQAHNTLRWQQVTQPANGRLPVSSGQLTTPDLMAAARGQSGHDLAVLTSKVQPVATWDDIVLPPDGIAQLRELCQRVVYQHRVLDDWGFSRKLSASKGVNALFAGPSGTGKTMAVEVIANELALDLYKIDLSQIVSKYIGDTEKNLDRIFAAARSSNSILFFDEADALFGKRSEVRDSHDRYANIEVSYLLQKMEEHDGIAILATNLRRNMDDAFTRRLTFSISFSNPDEVDRLRIWRKVWPAGMRCGDDLDLDFLARQFKLTGGNIRNVALAASFLAAEAESDVCMEHVIRAIRREFQKLGKVCVETDFGPYFGLLGSPGMEQVA